MKKYKLLFLACLMLALGACKKDSTPSYYESDGVILGADLGECPFCGGLKITFKDDPNPNPPAFYRIKNDPASIGIKSDTKFPVNVTASWKPYSAISNPGNYITIIRLKVNN